MIKLKGITWDHSRGYIPVTATSQRYMEQHKNVHIVWEKRSLKEFGDAPIDELASKYDMLILDHPWMGFASANNVLLPLEKFLDKDFIKDQEEQSVGKSYESYFYEGHQLAMAIDAAAPIAFYSPKKMNLLGKSIPTTWEEVMELASKGGVACAGNATSILMQFYMLCATKSEQTFTGKRIAPREVMESSLKEIKKLFSYMPKKVFSLNPIGIYELLAASSEKQGYCPFDFGYSNYSRRGYSNEKIKATNVVSYNGKMLKTVLGGAGFALSSKCKNIDIAVDYLKYTVSPEIQKSIYVENGGQPGHRAAWLDEEVNLMCLDFYKDTLATLDNAYLRPRYNGYLDFQETAGSMIRECVMKNSDIYVLIDELQELYVKSLGKVAN